MSNRTEITDELRELSPSLLAVKEQVVLPVVPDGYFDGLYSAVREKAEAGEPILNSVEAGTITVPDGYFEHFADDLLAKLKDEEPFLKQRMSVLKPSKVLQLSSRLVAAALMGIVVLSILGYRETTATANCSDGIACLTTDEIYQYVHSNSYEFELQQIQEGIRPYLESNTTNVNLYTKDAVQYIENNKNMLDVEDPATDIF